MIKRDCQVFIRGDKTMKKLLILISLIFLVACSGKSQPEAAPADNTDLQSQIDQKDARIADLEYQIEDLIDSITDLQSDYDSLEAASASSGPASNAYLCPVRPENMRYQNPVSAIAILEGWFAVQPQVQELQGSYSTQFWTGVNSRIHTIRYIVADTGLTETASFLIFFEEENWQEGLLSMSDQCWLDFPE
jgi:hypothetical protein